MKDELIGRVVGYPQLHTLDQSQVEDGDSLVTERMVWGRVESEKNGILSIQPIHGNDPRRAFISRLMIHTIMPEGYRA